MYIYISISISICIYIICMEYVLHTYGIKFLKQTHVDPLCDRHNGAVSLRRPGRLLPLDRITQSYTIQRIYIYIIYICSMYVVCIYIYVYIHVHNIYIYTYIYIYI